MAKKSQRSRAERRRLRRAEPAKPSLWRRIPLFWKIASGAVVLLVSAIQWSPTIDLGPADNPDDPLSYSFVVTTDGPLPVWATFVSCTYEDLEFANGSGAQNLGNVFKLGVIWPRQKRTIPCQRAIAVGKSFGVPLLRARLRVSVAYRAWLVYPTSTEQVYVTVRRDGKMTPWRPE